MQVWVGGDLTYHSFSLSVDRVGGGTASTAPTCACLWVYILGKNRDFTQNGPRGTWWVEWHMPFRAVHIITLHVVIVPVINVLNSDHSSMEAHFKTLKKVKQCVAWLHVQDAGLF